MGKGTWVTSTKEWAHLVEKLAQRLRGVGEVQREHCQLGPLCAARGRDVRRLAGMHQVGQLKLRQSGRQREGEGVSGS